MVSQLESEQINENSKLEFGLDCFLCDVCKLFVRPFPLQCPDCNSLFCEDCTKLEKEWRCTKELCQSTKNPEKLHHSVKAILEKCRLDCPGCSQTFEYLNGLAFNHIESCEKVPEELKYNESDLKEVVQQNRVKYS